MKKIALTVEDMKCDGCVEAVKSALQQVQGVRDIEITLADKRAHLEIEDDVSVDELIDAVSAAGYRAAPPI